MASKYCMSTSSWYSENLRNEIDKMEIINNIFVYKSMSFYTESEHGQCTLPVHPVMLDVMTEKMYVYGLVEEPFLIQIGKSQDVTIILQIHLNNGFLVNEQDDEFVYALAILGRFGNREGAKVTLKKFMEKKEEKLRRQPASFHSFLLKHTRQYFEMKIHNILQ